MCRIAGIVSSMPQEQSLAAMRRMLDRMARGGPDDEGTYQNGNVAFGHRRLAIIDLSSAGHQPMLHRGEKLTITFNGEIYNYLELRNELKKLGSVFKTATDTEVIMEAYSRWGTNAFAKLIGMFAFVIHDTANNKVILVRDGAGIKPLYYSLRNNILLFSSQVKAFAAYDPQWPEDERWKALFLSFGFLPHPYTTLKDVKALTRGCFIEVDLAKPEIKEVNYAQGISFQTPGDPVENVRRVTWNALKRHMISDAPLGVFLSGGIDSSLLTLMAAKETGDHLRTVSVNFNDATFDESKYQKIVLEKSGHGNHKSVIVDSKMLWNSIDDIWSAMDQPTIDGVNSYFVSLAAHEVGLKAVLSGLGADELFGGYASFRRMRWLSLLRTTKSTKILAAVAGKYKDAYKRLAFLSLDGPVGDHLFLRGIHVPSVVAKTLGIPEKQVWQTLKEVPSKKPAGSAGRSDAEAGLDNIQYASWLEQEFYMTSQLLKDTDCMSMHFGLEVRVPFLDQELTTVVQSIEARERFDSSRPKYLLTKAFEDLLPSEVVFRKKQGFTFPFAVWLQNKLKSGERIDSVWNNTNIEQDFINGSAHWSKYWSGVVLNNFRTRR
jgi:asparagine synthase (glutamine-hydrolysing)